MLEVADATPTQEKNALSLLSEELATSQNVPKVCLFLFSRSMRDLDVMQDDYPLSLLAAAQDGGQCGQLPAYQDPDGDQYALFHHPSPGRVDLESTAESACAGLRPIPS